MAKSRLERERRYREKHRHCEKHRAASRLASLKYYYGNREERKVAMAVWHGNNAISDGTISSRIAMESPSPNIAAY
jgi:hypothetical protein